MMVLSPMLMEAAEASEMFQSTLSLNEDSLAWVQTLEQLEVLPSKSRPERKFSMSELQGTSCRRSSVAFLRSAQAVSKTTGSGDERSLNAVSIFAISLSSAVRGIPNSPLAESP